LYKKVKGASPIQKTMTVSKTHYFCVKPQLTVLLPLIVFCHAEPGSGCLIQETKSYFC